MQIYSLWVNSKRKRIYKLRSLKKLKINTLPININDKKRKMSHGIFIFLQYSTFYTVQYNSYCTVLRHKTTQSAEGVFSLPIAVISYKLKIF